MKTEQWTIDKIKRGFDIFLKNYGRLPKAVEIDKLQYLPSSRWIQLRYGGLEKLRKKLGYTDVHFGKGRYRSDIAIKCNSRGRNAEKKLEKRLVQVFGEVFVHSEKMFGRTKSRLDFYIYAPEGNFGVDVFYPGDIKTLQSNTNIKMLKYKDFENELFFVVANEKISQKELNYLSKKKKNPLPHNIKLVTLEAFIQKIHTKKVFKNPIPA